MPARSTPTALLLLLLACGDKSDAVDTGGETSTTTASTTTTTSGTTATDRDGDGYVGDADCDDSDASVNPDAPETCNGRDDDCDGSVDEDATDASTWYADADGDGYGAGAGTSSCVAPSGMVETGTDCDDKDPTISPAASEICSDGVDEDCDGLVDDDDDSLDTTTASMWYVDADSDGFGGEEAPACTQSSGTVIVGGDCDDEDNTISPATPEQCDGIDNDCDGRVDGSGSIDATPWYLDTDGDGFGGADSEVAACEQPKGFIEDGTDCDDTSALAEWTYPGAAEVESLLDCMKDLDGDGYGDESPTTAGVIAGTDCDDNAGFLSPGEPEVCNDIDDDCNGVIDTDSPEASLWYVDSDGDGYGEVDSTNSTPDCAQPSGTVGVGGDCDDSDPTISPGASEVCDGGIDNDCSGSSDDDDLGLDRSTTSLWYADADGDDYGDEWDTTSACSAPSGYCADAGDCDDTDASVYPAAVETCDGVDDDCDGAIDETTVCYDDDGDGYTENSGDCDDEDAGTNPGAAEECDGGDDDCDGDIDELGVCYVGWSGLREISYDTEVGGSVVGTCEHLWTTAGAVSSTACSDCDFVFDVDATWDSVFGSGCADESDALGDELGYAADYAGAEMVLYGYLGTFYPRFYASLGGDELTYWTSGTYLTSPKYTITYDWYGVATLYE